MDKEIALILAEMLIKQDETTLQVKVIVEQVNGLTTEVKVLTTEVKGLAEHAIETNNIHRDFMGVSVKQLEQQEIFNEVIITQLKEIKHVLPLSHN